MGMSDVNRMIEQQKRMSIKDIELRELESLEYNLKNNPEVYADELEMVQKRYADLKAYYEQ